MEHVDDRTRRPRPPRIVLGFHLCRPGAGHGPVQTLTLQLIRTVEQDAAQVFKSYLGTDHAAYYAERAQTLANATNGTTYYKRDEDADMELRWQSNNDSPREWYAMRIESGKVHRWTLRVLLKLIERVSGDKDATRLPFQTGPAPIIEALLAMGAKPMQYLSAVSDHIIVEDWQAPEYILPTPAQEVAQ
jgi:hypothetical protein